MNKFKYPVYFLIILINFILQTTVFESLSIMGIKPNTAVIAVVSIAFLQGELDGIITGLFAGFLQDSFFSLYIGCNMFIYACIGFVCGYCFKAFYKESFLLPLVLVAAADLWCSFAFFVFNILLRGYMNFFSFLMPVVIPELVYTVLVSAFLYRFIYSVIEMINSRTGYRRRLF